MQGHRDAAARSFAASWRVRVRRKGAAITRASASWDERRSAAKNAAHFPRAGVWNPRTSHSPSLLGTNAVVRLRRHVADAEDLEPGRLERADRRLAARARALDEDLDLLQA